MVSRILKRRLLPPAMSWGLMALVIMVTVTTNCGRPARDSLSRWVPNLDTEFAAHLRADDDSSFAHFCARVGWSRVYHAGWLIGMARDTTSLEALARVDDELVTYRLKLARIYSSAFGLSELARQTESSILATPQARFRTLLADRRA